MDKENRVSSYERTPKIRYSKIVGVIQSGNVGELKTLLKNKYIELIDTKHQTVLHVAAKQGDVDLIRTLLEDWRVASLLDHEMYNDDTPLVAAARNNNVATVSALADFGADLWRQKLQSGDTILHFAARLQDPALMNTIVARNPPAKVINKINNFGETALDVALMEHSPNVPALLQAGADYSRPNVFTKRNVLHTSVACGQCTIVQELLSSQSSRHLTNLADRRGDTPLMLAIRTSCFDCVQMLMKYVKIGKEVNELTGESLLHMAVQTDRDDILQYVLMFSHEHVINYKDFEGRTPLLLAIENKKNECLKRLLDTQNVYEKNGKTQETALHAAVRVNNVLALVLLMKNYNHASSWCFTQRNGDGKTPFWVAIESNGASFVAEARKGRWVDTDELNQHGDSPTFVAAACGHLEVLKTLLLSEKYYDFCRENKRYIDFEGEKTVMEAEITCDIYSSDIFILIDEQRKNNSRVWIPKSLFNVNKNYGRNIFHACALGGNVYCLHFILSFVKTFNIELGLSLFDRSDKFGNTPLLLATRNDLGGSECVYYFLSHGANISSHNDSGEFVLESMLTNTKQSTDLLMTLLNDGIAYDTSAKGLQEESESLKVDFSLFRPSDVSVIRVVRLFYDKIHGEQRHKLLQHTLLKTYVHLVLISVNYFFILRFLLSCLSTVLLSAYLILNAHKPKEIASKSQLISIIRYLLVVLNTLGLLYSLPLLLYNELSVIGVLTATLMVSPCVTVLALYFLPYGTEFSFEIAAMAVLVAWFSLMMYSTTIFKEISHQIAMLTQVTYGMCIYAGTVIFVLMAFALAFFCIFNNSFYFVSTFKSFIYTAFVLLLAETKDSFDFFESKHSVLTNNTNFDGSIKTTSEFVASQFDLYFECLILLAFIIMVVFGLMNMLISLAVRDGKSLEAGGDIFRRRLQIHWISTLEMFLESFLYKVIRKTPLIYLLGIIPSRTLMDVKIKYLPMVEKCSSAFPKKSVQEMKRSVRRLRNSPNPGSKSSERNLLSFKS